MNYHSDKILLEVGMIVTWPRNNGSDTDRKARVLYIDKEKFEALIEWLPVNPLEVKPYAPINELRIIIGADNQKFFDATDVTEAQNRLKELLSEKTESPVKSACQVIHDLLPLVDFIPVSKPVLNLFKTALIEVLNELGVCK